MKAYKKVHKETVRSKLRMAIVRIRGVKNGFKRLKRIRGVNNGFKRLKRIRGVKNGIKRLKSSNGVEKEELILVSMDKGDVMGPILAVEEDLEHKLIDDLDEPLILLESYGMINKNELANGDVAPIIVVTPMAIIAPIVTVAPIVVAPIAVAPFVVAPIAVARVSPVVVAPVEPSFIRLGRKAYKIKQNRSWDVRSVYKNEFLLKEEHGIPITSV
nr:hypothetical protein [Tanacetum cinerariifolium]